MEIIESVLEYLGFLWSGLFSRPISELNGVQIGVLVLVYLLGWQVLKVLYKTSRKGASVIVTGTGNFLKLFSTKTKASKTVCLHCGRTLDKCICQSNKTLSLSKRLKKHKLELRALKITQKVK
jgi:hypothetical protein